MTEAVGVVGGGIMGAGIAEVAARSGCSVIVREIDDAACESSRERISASLQRAIETGKLGADEAGTVLARVTFTTDLNDLADSDVVVEAIVEDEPEKTKVFQALAKIVQNPDAVLASNTSSVPIMKLAAATDTPERILGMHFFNPAPVLPLVEVIPSLLTSEATVDRAKRFAERLGKQSVVCKDRAGFVVNALLVPYLLAAIRMVESGFATAEDIDTAMKAGCAHPMGPLALSDLIGLDTMAAVAQSMYAEFKEPLYAPPPLLLRMVEAGLLGRKRGRGFYDYR
jgi:3-hydroxybutyryl-CoA dehydrogenase